MLVDSPTGHHGHRKSLIFQRILAKSVAYAHPSGITRWCNSMRVLMGVSQNDHGVYHVRKKVPEHLKGAVARLLNSPKERVSWLKRTLRTKDVREANILAKPHLMEFDSILAKASALTEKKPLRKELAEREIRKIAEHHLHAQRRRQRADDRSFLSERQSRGLQVSVGGNERGVCDQSKSFCSRRFL